MSRINVQTYLQVTINLGTKIWYVSKWYFLVNPLNAIDFQLA